MKTIAIALATLLLAACGFAWWQHGRIGSLGSDLAKAKTTVAVQSFELTEAGITERVVTRLVDRVRVIHDHTTALQQDIPAHVTPSTDARFPLPVGFVRVHDAAASGLPLDAAGPTDAEASTVTASRAASVVASNYGSCRETAEQLIALQDWLRSMQEAAPGQESTSP